MKTKAAILVAQNEPLIIDEVDVPQLSFGQVLVDISASRICGSQIGEIDGAKGPDRWLPHLLGHEGGGTVLEVGPGVTTVSAGDRVVLHWRPGKGVESACPKYGWNSKVANAGHITTFNEVGVISENRLTKVPEDTDWETCCLMADTLTTGFGVICNDARLKIGESAVVIGCGGIGLGVVLGAHLAGAYPVIAVDLVDHKLQKAVSYGATHTVNASESDMREAVLEVVSSSGADVVIDGTGQPSVIEQAYALTGKSGRCVLFGVMHHSKSINIHTLPLHFGKVLTGSEGGGSLPDSDIPRYLNMINAGRFDPADFVSHRGGLEDVNDLICEMRNGKVSHAIMHYS